MLYLHPLLSKLLPLLDVICSAAALRRSPHTTAQSNTLSMLANCWTVLSLYPVIVSALLVRRNSSAAIYLQSISNVNLRLNGSPSTKPQIRTPSPEGVTS